MNTGVARSAVRWPFSLAYGTAVGIRNLLYDRGILPARRAGIPVISVGNLAAGGTGKTPFVIMLAGMLRRAGRRVAVVSRGYRRLNPTHKPLLVSDGRAVRCSLAESGDEPYLIARRLLDGDGNGAMVIVGADRLEAAFLAKSLGAEAVILDDGFQHRRLHRELDIVLLDASRPLDNGLLLPAGMLREGPASLRRADAVVLTRARGEITPAILKKWLRPRKPVLFTRHRPRPPVPIAEWRAGKRDDRLDGISGRVLLFSGIARPDSFEDSVQECGLEVSRHLRYPDHHHYGKAELEAIAQASRGHSAAVTTEKDAVRLPPDWDLEGRLMVLGLELELIPGESHNLLEQLITDKVFP